MNPLIYTAITLGVIHTAIGPDHYIPFVALSKANNWTYKKTMTISAICGLGHCLSSVLIGVIGIGLGVMIGKVEWIEGVRGDIASYLMVAFGLVYFAWSLKSLLRGKEHAHEHGHGKIFHSHTHSHNGEHIHGHGNKNIVWGMFIVFLFGPCEPLIPILMYPAVNASFIDLVLVVIAFTVSTVFVMLSAVTLSLKGLSFVNVNKLEKYSHSLASLSIVVCGLLIIAGL